MSGEVVPFRSNHTMNIDRYGEFLCLVCGHWLTCAPETEWGDLFVVRPERFGHMHGTEPFHYYQNCGAEIITQEEWVERYPYDSGKTISEIERRFY